MAHGANNDNPLSSRKGAVGTILIRHDIAERDELAIMELWVHGDTESDLEEQSYAVLSGITEDDFVYDVVSLTGELITMLLVHLHVHVKLILRFNYCEICLCCRPQQVCLQRQLDCLRNHGRSGRQDCMDDSGG